MYWPDVLELLDYWREWPPAHVTLALRYLERKPKAKAPQSPADAMAQIQQMSQFMGGAQKLPDRLRAMAEEALALQARLNKRPS